ncbi:DHA2 family multidrug resistance protein-like MFS transporter [Actinomadura pelletieri DSM 43383]|uniref:DHA2 family multidrug resistance protein-like MFS transporter n=1 Tax=Actinomadura pelletieri DSM 43383 TaxID=1120940 RepID=A0A495QGA2_9ACTN|nr:MFS transporter [Actinomadura pelletieri]RKS70889.1 DHA2 family multidrug resistance protein-like MFS transporter [Actinomadura pelletieri DSM 43383]
MTATVSPRGVGAVPPHPHRWAGLAVLSASLLLIVMDITILNVALPEMSADLRPSAVELLWMVDAYSLVVAGLLVTAAALGDRWGRRRMLVAGFSVFGLASLGVLVAGSPGEVIAIRALLGAGGAMIMPSTLSMIRHLFTDPRERATALGVWATTAALGAALGPIIGGLLLEAFSWHSAFLVHVPVMAVAIVAALWLLPESRNPRPGRWDAVGTALSIVGMTALVYTIKDVGDEGITGANVVTGVVAVAGLGWFVRRCLRRPEPLLDVRLFRGRAFTAGTVVALVSSLSIAAIMLLLAQWMQLVQGYSALETGIRLLPEVVGAAVFSPLAPALAARLGARTVLAGGLAVGGIGYLVIFVAGEPLGYWPVALSTFLVGVGMGALAVASAVIMAGAPPERSGSAAAVEETGYELGATLGVAVLGSVAAAVYRDGLSGFDLAGHGVTGQAAHDVRESLGGAMEVARGAGAAGNELAARAQEVFTTSLSWAGLAGSALMLAAAAVVWMLTPRDLDIADTEH